jgi:hypothetical protein
MAKESARLLARIQRESESAVTLPQRAQEAQKSRREAGFSQRGDMPSLRRPR